MIIDRAVNSYDNIFYCILLVGKKESDKTL